MYLIFDTSPLLFLIFLFSANISQLKEFLGDSLYLLLLLSQKSPLGMYCISYLIIPALLYLCVVLFQDFWQFIMMSFQSDSQNMYGIEATSSKFYDDTISTSSVEVVYTFVTPNPYITCPSTCASPQFLRQWIGL